MLARSWPHSLLGDRPADEVGSVQSISVRLQGPGIDGISQRRCLLRWGLYAACVLPMTPYSFCPLPSTATALETGLAACGHDPRAFNLEMFQLVCNSICQTAVFNILALAIDRKLQLLARQLEPVHQIHVKFLPKNNFI